MSTPDEPPLVVSADVIAERAGVALDAATRPVIERAVRDVQDDVEAHLGRVITPVTYTEDGLVRPPPGGDWDLQRYPLVEIVTVTAETDDAGQQTGLFTVTYRAGLDARADRDLRPILRYVTAHALAQPELARLWRADQPDGGRRATSLSVEGQSASYEYLTPAGTTAAGRRDTGGGLPTLESLDRWRIAGRRVFQRRGRPGPPWPHGGDREWVRWWP